VRFLAALLEAAELVQSRGMPSLSSPDEGRYASLKSTWKLSTKARTDQLSASSRTRRRVPCTPTLPTGTTLRGSSRLRLLLVPRKPSAALTACLAAEEDRK